MPVGELSDLLDFSAELEGGCYTVQKKNAEFIPYLR